jgi:peptidoglycan/xylan/chitin deacetylase (PgdA/CDA1 family)
MPHRIVVITSNLSYAVRKGIVEIDNAVSDVDWLVILHSPRKTPRQLLRSQWLNLRRNGWRWIPYELSDLWHRASPGCQARPAPKGPGSEYSEESLRRLSNIRIDRVTDLHAPASLALVRAFEPELGVSLAAPILRRTLFSIPEHGTLNLHKGKLPEFRGMPPAFWELWQDQDRVGCSVHQVDDGLDTGALVAECSLPCPRHATVRGLQLQLDEIGIELMTRAVQDVLTRRAIPRPQPLGEGIKTHRKPTLLQEAELQRKLARRAVGPRKRVVKQILASGVFGLHRLGLDRLLAPRITVLLYHRVSDDVRDNLTVGIEQFDRHMGLVARHFEPVAIESVLAASIVRRSPRPLVCVTFDDGYLDNYRHAAPILRRHGIPAAFFIATGIVGSEQPFPHDVKRGNQSIPVMNWDQIRALRRWGFSIGSHTVHHIDCAAEPEELVRSELQQSLADLQRELAVEQPVFAYPYGGKHHMTPQRLELVREAGYSGCLSAYGGANVDTVDRFNVFRRSINFEYSDRAFLLECLGLT